MPSQRPSDLNERTGRRRGLRAWGIARAGLLAASLAVLLILPSVLLGDVDQDDIYAEIAVVRNGQIRWHSSDQLPPDGRLVFQEFASKRSRWGSFHAPREIASWVFRVQPDVEEVRIDVYRGRPGRPVGSGAEGRAPYEFLRGDFSVS